MVNEKKIEGQVNLALVLKKQSSQKKSKHGEYQYAIWYGLPVADKPIQYS